MSRVPGWYVGACWIVAIGLSICVGLSYREPRMLALFAAAAIATAALPTRRFTAVIGVLVGLTGSVWAVALVQRGIAVEIGMRGPGAIGMCSGWMLIASGLRAMFA